MVKKIYLLMGIILLTGCDTKLRDLTMKKTPYFGDELRIDGYYYSDALHDQYANLDNIGVAVFYRDGFCIYTGISIPTNQGVISHQDILSRIENEILLNDARIAKMMRDPTEIGVFQIMYPDIQLEVWGFRSWTFTYFGKIVNDTTFVTNKRIYHHRGSKETYIENRTYRFVQFSQKPDSTNNYVK